MLWYFEEKRFSVDCAYSFAYLIKPFKQICALTRTLSNLIIAEKHIPLLTVKDRYSMDE